MTTETKTYKTLLYEKIDGNVARITQNRPELRNAQNIPMTKELDKAFHEAVEDLDVRVIILAGAGPTFSSGHDLKAAGAGVELLTKWATKPGGEGRWWREDEIFLDACLRWRDLPKPTIAAVQGYCIMGGFMLATMCDIIIAAEDAKFADRAPRERGVAVEFFSHPWELGPRMCKQWLMTGDYLDAQEAYRLGMANKVVPVDKLQEETLALAKKIAMTDPFSLKLIKFMVNYVEDLKGFRLAAQHHFTMHQFTHSHRAEIGYQAYTSGGRSVKDMLKERDTKYENK